MRQKSENVCGSGPWVAMYALGFWKPCKETDVMLVMVAVVVVVVVDVLLV